MNEQTFRIHEFLEEARESLRAPGRSVELSDLAKAMWSVLHYLIESQSASREQGSATMKAPDENLRDRQIAHANDRISQLREETRHEIAQLEARLSASQPARESEKPSSVATETVEESKPTSNISSNVSFHANRIGLWELSAPQAIWDWLNSQVPRGELQVVEVGMTLTSKASTPPTGLESLILRPSGVVGSAEPLSIFDRPTPSPAAKSEEERNG